MDYVWQKNDDDETLSCDSCGAPVPLKRFMARGPRGVGDHMLCACCANSNAGNSLENPTAYRNPSTLKTIAAVANQVLIQLGAFDKKDEHLELLAQTLPFLRDLSYDDDSARDLRRDIQKYLEREGHKNGS